MNYTVEQFTGTVDTGLSDFFEIAQQRGLENNSSVESIYSYRDERRHALFLLRDGQDVIGTFGAHSFELFPNAYRVCARACILTDRTQHSGLRTVNQIRTHSNVLAIYGLKTCIEWVNEPDANLYITTHPSHVGAMKLMHRIVLPEFEKTGLVSKVGEFVYRNSLQTFWKLDVSKYYEQIQ